MALHILLSGEQSKHGVIHLKNCIDKASINGITETQVERASHSNGQMGAGDIISSITTIIEAAEKPVTGLIKCLQKYVDNYRTEITIPTKNGKKIILSHGRSMKAAALQELIVAIQKSSNLMYDTAN